MAKGTTTEAPALATARLQWQFGQWDALSAIEPNPSQAPARAQGELLQYVLQGALQTGRIDDARQALAALREAGEDRGEILRALVSSAFNSLGRGWLAFGEIEKAEHCIRRAIGIYPERGDQDLVTGMRLSQQAGDLGLAVGRNHYRSLRKKDRRLFIDCGAYDGCSALMFLMTNPHFDCVSLEPNPEFWKYYDELPTRLIRKAAYTYDGQIDFIIDPVDGDGSSLFQDKPIDFHRKVRNEDCPVISTPCIDVSAFVRTAAETYGTIVLKLDVEGAEYDILDKMLEDGTIALVDQLLCEFHGAKMGWDQAREERIVARVEEHTPIEPWDARAFSIHGAKNSRALRMRQALIDVIQRNRESFQPLIDIQRQDGDG